MRVAIRVDAGPRIGGGHTMRCLTLADRLALEGAEVAFVTAAMPEAASERITASGHRLNLLPVWPRQDLERPDWHRPPLDARAQQQDAEASERACGAVDWVIVDHYLLDRHWHSAARRFAERVLVIDDLANRSYDCDLLLDQTLGRSATHYKGLVPDAATVLAGSHYALLRPEFERERAAALERRRCPKPVGRILVSLGTTDPDSITGRIVDAVSGAAPGRAIDVVMTEAAASLAVVQELAKRRSGISVHINSERMAELTRDADLAIGAAGTSSWERCSLGLPAIVLILAENQLPSADALEQAGAVIRIEAANDLQVKIAEIENDVPDLQRMSAAAFAITDGRGTARLVRAMGGHKTAEPHSAAIGLRNAVPDDAETLWLWRNDPVTRANSRTTEPVSWTDHVRWLTAVIDDPDRHLLIAERAGSPVGTIRLDALAGQSDSVELSINVRPDVRGEGVGRTMLQSACDRLAVQNRGCLIRASVRVDNQGSRRLFESCGFRSEGEEDGWVRYVLMRQHRSASVQRKLA